MMHITDNQDALLDYLYEEGDPDERLKIAKHVQECAQCSVALVELQSVRGLLAEWTPPAAPLGFRIVQDSPAASRVAGGAPVAGRPWRSRLVSGWTQAAAGVLLFAAGVIFSQLTFDYGDNALVVRVGPPPPVAAPAQTSAAASALPAPLPAPPVAVAGPQQASAAAPAPEVEYEQLLQRVRAMIDQSEQRQQRELALRLSQIAREVDTQHQADLLRIQQNFGDQQEEMMNYLVRTSGGSR